MGISVRTCMPTMSSLWYYYVPRYCRSYAKGNHRSCSINHEDQDHCSTRKKILCLDWWFHLGFTLHLPSYVDHQGRIRRSRSIHRPQKVLLSALNLSMIGKAFLSTLVYLCLFIIM